MILSKVDISLGVPAAHLFDTLPKCLLSSAAFKHLNVLFIERLCTWICLPFLEMEGNSLPDITLLSRSCNIEHFPIVFGEANMSELKG